VPELSYASFKKAKKCKTKRKKDVCIDATGCYAPKSRNQEWGLPHFLLNGSKVLNFAKMDEQALIKLYVELTGMPEAAGRDVFMMLCKQDGQDPTTAELTNSSSDEIGEPGGALPRQDLSSIRNARSAGVSAAVH
jgi:hypothetical protein